MKGGGFSLPESTRNINIHSYSDMDSRYFYFEAHVEKPGVNLYELVKASGLRESKNVIHAENVQINTGPFNSGKGNRVPEWWKNETMETYLQFSN